MDQKKLPRECWYLKRWLEEHFISGRFYTIEELCDNVVDNIGRKLFKYNTDLRNHDKSIQLSNAIRKINWSITDGYKIIIKDSKGSAKLCESSYRLCIQNNDYIVITKVDDINKVLIGEETICYPACEMDIFKTENGKPAEIIKSGYGKYKNDIRYKVLCDMFKILEFSKNRIDPHKEVKDFYECEFRLEDFMKYWGEKMKWLMNKIFNVKIPL